MNAERMPVAILGATGIVGQHLVRLLAHHPTLRLAEVVGSGRRDGKRYDREVDWIVGPEPPESASGLIMRGLDGDRPGLDSPIVLSALPSAEAAVWERPLAQRGHIVCTNASAHRLSSDAALIIPEVNGETLEPDASGLVGHGGGALVANPNCVVAGVALVLAPLEWAFGIDSVTIVTLQALSGAGVGGPSALSMAGNVVPWIEGEEEKFEPELRRLLRSRLEVAVTVNRVPVVDGHTAHLFVKLKRPAPPQDVKRALRSFRGRDAALDDPGLPTLPADPLCVLDAVDRPQPRLDADRGGGMTVSVGRIRAAPPHDVALTVVVHNAMRGAAGGCLANAELCLAKGLVRAKSPAA